MLLVGGICGLQTEMVICRRYECRQEWLLVGSMSGVQTGMVISGVISDQGWGCLSMSTLYPITIERVIIWNKKMLDPILIMAFVRCSLP